MVDMKRKKNNNNNDNPEIGMDEPPYPYGLQLRLNEEDMKKLGIGIMPTGSEVNITAKTIVTSTAEYDSIDQEESNNADMSLQITNMTVDMKHDSDVAGRFYGKEKDKK